MSGYLDTRIFENQIRILGCLALVSLSTVHVVLFNKNPVYPDNTHPYSWFKVSTGSFAPKGNEVLDFKNASHLHRN